MVPWISAQSSANPGNTYYTAGFDASTHPLHAVGLGVIPPLIVFLVAVLDLYFVHKAAEAVTKIDVDSLTSVAVATVAVATPMAVATPTAVATAPVVSNS